jgi:hypothetical protein
VVQHPLADELKHFFHEFLCTECAIASNSTGTSSGGATGNAPSVASNFATPVSKESDTNDFLISLLPVKNAAERVRKNNKQRKQRKISYHTLTHLFLPVNASCGIC